MANRAKVDLVEPFFVSSVCVVLSLGGCLVGPYDCSKCPRSFEAVWVGGGPLNPLPPVGSGDGTSAGCSDVRGS
jgi:hypothetical protein